MTNTPLTRPTQFLKYGSGAHTLLCYAQMRKDRPFILSDYKEFQLDRIKGSKISDYIIQLSKCGYLQKINHPNPPNKQTFFIYRITPLGQHALQYLGRYEREKFEKKMREHAQVNGKKGALKNFGKQPLGR